MRDFRASRVLRPLGLTGLGLLGCQSRVAKMEAGDPTVYIDLLVESLPMLAASDRELAEIMARR